MNVCAVIPAGGQGTRLGGTVPKQFQTLREKPILHYTLRTFQESGLISSLVRKRNWKVPAPTGWSVPRLLSKL